MLHNQNLFKISLLFSLALVTACSDDSFSLPTPEETGNSGFSWWEAQYQSKNVFRDGSLVSFTKDSDSGLRLFFHDANNWHGDAYHLLDTTFTLSEFRYILVDYTISDTSSCSVDKMKLYMDGKSIPFDLDSTQGNPQKHFRNTFDLPDFVNDHVFKIRFDSEECHNIELTYNVNMSKEPGVCWMATDINSDPAQKSSFPAGDLILGLKPVLWYSFGEEILIPDTTYSHCILVKAGSPPDTLRLPLQFTEPSGHDIPTAYLSYHNSEKFSNFMETDSVAQLSCALFYQKWQIPSAPKNTNHYTFSRTLSFSPKKTTLPEREIVKQDSVNFQVISSKNYGFGYFIAKYKLKGNDTLYYQKVNSDNKSQDQDIQTFSISPNDTITALIDSVSILMVRDGDAESYPIYKDLIYLKNYVPAPSNGTRLPIDSTGIITETFNRLAETLVKDTTIRSYMILNTIIESPVIETVPDEAIDE